MKAEEILNGEIKSWIRTCPKCSSIIEKKSREEKWKCKFCGWE